MTAQTISQAVATVDNSPGALIQRYADDFAVVIPATGFKPATFVRLAQGLLRRDKNLARVAAANPGSFMAALLECARLGHEPGTPAYYLVPFGNEITGIEGYTGKIDRIYRAGAVSAVIAECVYDADTFTHAPAAGTPPDHQVDWSLDDRGDLRLVYAYAVLKDGSNSKVVVLNGAQIARHRNESGGSDKPTSPWVKWPESMWLKTSVHELEKWIPSSAEYREEMLRSKAAADTVVETRALPPLPDPEPAYDPDTGEVVDAELVSEEPSP